MAERSIYNVAGFDTAPDNRGIYVFTNNSNGARAVFADSYDFSGKRIMIFNIHGRLIEAGGDIYANSNTERGSPQLSFTVPRGGFAAVFDPSASESLEVCYKTAMEGAMLYNATMAVAYEVHANYCRINSKLTVEYSRPNTSGAEAISFLFVGNSATYFNGTPIQFKALAAAAGKEISVDYCTYGSAYLGQFADSGHERGIALRNKLKNGIYDHVVLQDANGASYEDIRDALDIILPIIKDAGAMPMLYMRYGYADTVEKSIAEARRHHITYCKTAAEYDLVCAPAADAFPVCFEKHPDIELYADDGEHHSSSGAYLIACVWLKSFLGIDPTGNTYTATQTGENAKKLQECAKHACEYGYEYSGHIDN